MLTPHDDGVILRSMFKSCGLFLLSLIIGGTSAQATIYEYKFTNGNKLIITPEKGGAYLWSSKDGSNRLVTDERVNQFESTDPKFSKLKNYIVTDENMTLMPAKESFVTFIRTDSGLYAITETGEYTFIAPSKELIVSNNRTYIHPREEFSSPTERYRGLAFRIQQPNRLTTGFLVAFTPDLKMIGVKMPDIPNPDAYFEYSFSYRGPDNGLGGIVIGLKAWGRFVQKEFDETAPDKLARRLTHFNHYTVVQASASQLTQAQQLRAQGLWTTLFDKARETGHASRIFIEADDIQVMANYLKVRQSQYLSNLISYSPIRYEREDIVGNWINESRTLEKATADYGYVLLFQHQGRIQLVFHPRGSGKDLQTSLSECNSLL